MRLPSSRAPLLALCLLGMASAATLQHSKSPSPAHTPPRRARAAAAITPISVHLNAAAGGATLDSGQQPTVINLPGAHGVSHPAQILVLLLSQSPPAPAASTQCQVNAGSEPSSSARGSPAESAALPDVEPDLSTLVVPDSEPNHEHPAAAPSRRNAPTFPPVEDSQILLQQFRAQVARTPSLPPVVTQPLLNYGDDVVVYVPEATETSSASFTTATDGDASGGQHERTEGTDRCNRECRQRFRSQPPEEVSPPLPRFDRSMRLKAVFTAYQADYSEPYTVWWDAASGASRIDYHEGAASTYRMMRQDGRVQSLQIRVDRTGETDVRRCAVTAPRRMSLAMRALPVLPDLDGFTFAGYLDVAAGGARVERWRRALRGEGAAGTREVLTYRHELLVVRAPDNFTTTPLRYAVAVDSSLLGDNCDSYAHRFLNVETRHHDPAMFRLNIGDACEQIVTTDRIDLVEPLREFTMLQRDKRHDVEFQRYKTQYARRYADELEESVRNNVLVQSTRFVSSGNRNGASFELENNFLSDRLQVEKDVLLGAEEMDDSQGQTFPHSAEELKGLRGRLPRSFDWRTRGAVTPVRYQSTCSSCWAFSVVGAVEGALFVKTGRLVPLSEQSLVDCGKPYGTNGCSGTWPNFAYDYVQHQGLPALDEYTPYAAKVLECKAERVPAVTRISGYVNVTSLNIIALKVAIQRHGPTVVLLDAKASSFAAYKGGYYYDAKCRKSDSNHAMLAVGWTVHRGETYFILKNWWSAAWGEEGYIRMRAATNTCGVLRLPSYPVLRRADVLRVPAGATAAITPPATATAPEP